MTKEKLQEIFESTQESGLKYDGTIKSIDYYSVLCKAASKDALYSVKNMDEKSNLCMFNYCHEGKDSIMMIFYVPANSSNGVKHIAEKVMNVVRHLEETFVTIDYIDTKEMKDEKFVYIVAIKSLE